MNRRRWGWLLLIVVVIALAMLPLVVDDYGADLIDRTAIFAIVAVGLNLLCGSTGQFSLGHAGFYAIGAFTAGILGSDYNWPFWLNVPVAGLLAAAAGLALGIPALRLSGPYLAIATLGFGLLIQQVLGTADWAKGRTGITLNPPQIGALSVSPHGFFWIALGVLVVGGVAAYNLRRGAAGRAFVALRESEPAAQASGVNLARYRVTAFALSACYAGIAGALYATLESTIFATSFDLALSIGFLTMIVVGGLDSTVGAVVGAILLTYVRDWLQNGAPHMSSQIVDGLYGVLLVLMLLFVPGGLMGLLALARRWLQRGRTVPAVEVSRG